MLVAEAEQITAHSTVEEVRARLFDGLAPVNVFAAAVGRSPRQIAAWISQGLPIARVGKTPFVKIDAARDWLRARERKPSGTISSQSQCIAA
jgi:hypothetical protein